MVKILLMTPGPTNVHERVTKAMTRPIIHHRSQDFRELYASIEENLKYVFQSKNEIFVLTSSGTGGVECALSNVIRRGDKILVPVSGDFGHRIKETIEAFEGEVVEIPIKWGSAVSFEKIQEAVDKERDLKAIAIVYNETSTGAVTKCLKDIGKLANEKGILSIVDAVSAIGGEELPVDDWDIDLCATCSQKSIAAPPGLAMLSVSKKTWEILDKTAPMRRYFNLKNFRVAHERNETPFTPAVALFYALDEALKMLKEEGLENRIATHRICAKAFYSAAEAMGLEILADEAVRSNTVIALKNPPKVSNKEIQHTMLNKHEILLAGGMGQLRGSTFRIGNMGIISKEKVITTVNALEDTLRVLGLDIENRTGVKAAEMVFN